MSESGVKGLQMVTSRFHSDALHWNARCFFSQTPPKDLSDFSIFARLMDTTGMSMEKMADKERIDQSKPYVKHVLIL